MSINVFHSNEIKAQKEKGPFWLAPGEAYADNVIYIDKMPYTTTTRIFNRIGRKGSWKRIQS